MMSMQQMAQNISVLTVAVVTICKVNSNNPKMTEYA